GPRRARRERLARAGGGRRRARPVARTRGRAAARAAARRGRRAPDGGGEHVRGAAAALGRAPDRVSRAHVSAWRDRVPWALRLRVRAARNAWALALHLLQQR